MQQFHAVNSIAVGPERPGAGERKMVWHDFPDFHFGRWYGILGGIAGWLRSLATIAGKVIRMRPSMSLRRVGYRDRLLVAAVEEVWFARYVIVEHDGIVCGTTGETLDAFVRVVQLPKRRLIAVAHGHTCSWDAGGAQEITGPVLDRVEQLLAIDPAASLKSLFDAAREAFLVAAEPFPEDDDFGPPAVQLTVVELSSRRLLAQRLGRHKPIIVRNGKVYHYEAEPPGFNAIKRVSIAPGLLDSPLHDGDLVTVYPLHWFSDPRGFELPRIVAKLARAYRDPRDFVEAALLHWTHELNKAQQAGLDIKSNAVLVAVRI